MKKIQIFDSFWLKILACIFMAFDHIGLVFGNLYPSIYLPFRIIGRIAFPLFLFLSLQSCIHTSNYKKYLARLGISALIISIAILVMNFAMNLSMSGFYNIFITLILFSLCYISLFKTKTIWTKFLIIIPIAYLIFSSLYSLGYFYVDYRAGLALDAFIPDYSFYTLILLIPLLIGSYLLNCYSKKKANQAGVELTEFKKSPYHQNLVNGLMSISIVITSLVCYLLTYVESLASSTITMFSLETYSVLSVIFILLYNGKRGYYNAVIKYGFYLYYPLHIVIIYGIFMLITL